MSEQQARRRGRGRRPADEVRGEVLAAADPLGGWIAPGEPGRA